MATTNPVNEPKAVKLRKRRDLETTMNTLKQLLAPTLASKTGSRKKKKPRSLAKKVIVPKKANPFQNYSDGEYYPNKMKRKIRSKKTVLKPRHELKVVLATNKRKRGTPHKGLESHNESPMARLVQEPLEIVDTTPLQSPSKINGDTEPIVPTSSCLQTNSVQAFTGLNTHTKPLKTYSNLKKDTCNVKQTFCSLSVDTELKNTDWRIHTQSSNPNKYELISPPHKSLTDMTIDDLIRMDEDSLSDENLMEILTCPSPVWWENPNECTGSLFLASKAENTAKRMNNDVENATADVKDQAISIKRTATLSGIKKDTKIAKLETILGHIKSLVQTDNTLVNDVANDGNITDTNSIPQEVENYEEATMKEIHPCEFDTLKRRKISSSGSEISINEDDLLKNLESINIPVQEEKVDEDTEKDEKFIDYVKEHEVISLIDRETPICDVDKEHLEKNKSDDSSDNLYETEKSPELYRKKYRNKNKESTSPSVSKKEASEPENKEVKTSILKRLQKDNDDIIDVRLIKVPTNITNEVKVWSKLDNFKRHNFKPQDFVNEVIDIEDELEFSMIETSPLKGQHKSKGETILIEDDSNDGIHVNTTLKVNDTISMDDIEQCSDVTLTAILGNDESSQNYEIIDLGISKEMLTGNKDIILKDTLSTDYDLDGRLEKTASVLQNDSIKPKRKRKNAAGSKEPCKKNTNKVKKKKCHKISGIKILPMEAVLPKPESLKSIPAEISYQYLNNKYAKRINFNKHKQSSIVKPTDDTILCLDGVDVSLVKNPVQGIVKINEIQVKENDLSITLVKPALNTTESPTKDITESPTSEKSESNVEFSEITISDTNTQFIDEYEDNNSRANSEKNSQMISEELDFEIRKDIILVKQAEEKQVPTKDSDHNAEDNISGNIDMVLYDGNICGLENIGDQTFEIKYLFEDVQSLDEDVNKDGAVKEQANLDKIIDENITENIDEIEIVEHSLEDIVVKVEEENDKIDDIEDLHRQDVGEVQTQNTTQDELVTIYKIENTGAKEF